MTDILCLSMSPATDWFGRGTSATTRSGANRNRHVLEGLLRHRAVGRIISVDFLPINFKKAIRQYTDGVLRPIGVPVRRSLFSTLSQVNDRLFVLSTVTSVLSRRLLLSLLRETLFHLGVRDHWLWSYHPFFPDLMGTTGESVAVFDTVDNWAAHPVYAGYRERLERSYRTIGDRANVIFTVNDGLHGLFPGHHRVLTVPNGVDLEHYRRPTAAPADVQFTQATGPIVVYEGVMQRRVDFDLIATLARMRPNYQFLFIGPVWPDADVASVQAMPNVQFLGPRSYDALPAYLTHSTVGIIPHRIDQFTASMDPLKLYEYLASGVPVVTTAVAGSGRFKRFVHVADGASDFARALDEAIVDAERSDRDAIRTVVKDASWDRRVADMVTFIDRSAAPTADS